ncbi:GIY-YIG nuclease family protein [Dethiothermospora halolimnae]|uniref:GIY-YIG nuclease family protein n=1 Tax=Dethiothermospora halolimnae TaxID=3114390 RepID=UPI003CCC1EA0
MEVIDLELREKVKNLPQSPGIYIMKDKYNNIIYIGKSKNLKKRVSQYFQKSKNHSRKIVEMIQFIENIDHTITDTELEALLLESKLIKKYNPKYNRLLKNYQRYPYIKVTTEEEVPRLLIVTEKNDDNASYFGPFTNFNRVNRAVDSIKDYFKIRRCSINNFNSLKTSCLHYDLNTCSGPCKGEENINKYRDNIKRLISFLNNEDMSIIEEVKSKMIKASKNMEYNRAVKLRDDLNDLKYVTRNFQIIKNSNKNQNIILFEKISSEEVKVFYISSNRLLYKETIKVIPINKSVERIRKSMGEVFKEEDNEIIDKLKIDELHIISYYLKRQDITYLEVCEPVLKFSTKIKDKLLETIE